MVRCGVDLDKCVEIVAFSEAEEDITLPPEDETQLTTMGNAVAQVFREAQITVDELALLEIHDCFTITALLGLEAIGCAPLGGAPDYILAGHTMRGGRLPTNVSGGLIGFGHPTGATGVRMVVDVIDQLTEQSQQSVPLKTSYGMIVNMGGNDKTLTAMIFKKV